MSLVETATELAAASKVVATASALLGVLSAQEKDKGTYESRIKALKETREQAEKTLSVVLDKVEAAKAELASETEKLSRVKSELDAIRKRVA